LEATKNFSADSSNTDDSEEKIPQDGIMMQYLQKLRGENQDFFVQISG
jgi:hypothetical protein